jgi:hypothetical protein
MAPNWIHKISYLLFVAFFIFTPLIANHNYMESRDYYIVIFIFIYDLYVRLRIISLHVAGSAKFFAIIFGVCLH